MQDVAIYDRTRIFAEENQSNILNIDNKLLHKIFSCLGDKNQATVVVDFDVLPNIRWECRITLEEKRGNKEGSHTDNELVQEYMKKSSNKTKLEYLETVFKYRRLHLNKFMFKISCVRKRLVEKKVWKTEDVVGIKCSLMPDNVITDSKDNTLFEYQGYSLDITGFPMKLLVGDNSFPVVRFTNGWVTRMLFFTTLPAAIVKKVLGSDSDIYITGLQIAFNSPSFEDDDQRIRAISTLNDLFSNKVNNHSRLMEPFDTDDYTGFGVRERVKVPGCDKLMWGLTTAFQLKDVENGLSGIAYSKQHEDFLKNSVRLDITLMAPGLFDFLYGLSKEGKYEQDILGCLQYRKGIEACKGNQIQPNIRITPRIMKKILKDNFKTNAEFVKGLRDYALNKHRIPAMLRGNSQIHNKEGWKQMMEFFNQRIEKMWKRLPVVEKKMHEKDEWCRDLEEQVIEILSQRYPKKSGSGYWSSLHNLLYDKHTYIEDLEKEILKFGIDLRCQTMTDLRVANLLSEKIKWDRTGDYYYDEKSKASLENLFSNMRKKKSWTSETLEQELIKDMEKLNAVIFNDIIEAPNVELPDLETGKVHFKSNKYFNPTFKPKGKNKQLKTRKSA